MSLMHEHLLKVTLLSSLPCSDRSVGLAATIVQSITHDVLQVTQ